MSDGNLFSQEKWLRVLTGPGPGGKRRLDLAWETVFVAVNRAFGQTWWVL